MRLRLTREVAFYRDWITETFDDATRRLGFVVRTVEGEGRALRSAFDYGREAERNFPSMPTARHPAPMPSRVTGTGQRLIRVI